MNSCGSLWCIGGVSGACNEKSGTWSNNKVTCAKGPSFVGCYADVPQDRALPHEASGGMSRAECAAACADYE